jgi:hypothetical protein
MPCRQRAASAGFVYHALNRATGRATLLAKAGDCAAFEPVLRQAHDRFASGLLVYAALSNNGHLVVWRTA